MYIKQWAIANHCDDTKLVPNVFAPACDQNL